MRVLIVDDERNIRESIGRLLQLEGIDSAVATDGRDGAAKLAETAFDAAIVDLKMPSMDGQQLLEWIRSEGLRLPVIMISALGEIKDAVKALKSGANDYLIKPFDPAELILKVRALVASRKRQDLDRSRRTNRCKRGQAYWRRAGHEGATSADREGRSGRHHGPDHGRERNRQRSGGPGDPRAFPARAGALRGREHRRRP